MSYTATRKIVGFNIWDEEWEVGALSTISGSKQSNSECIRTTNYISLIPNTKIFLNGGAGTIRPCFYGENKDFLRSPAGLSNTVYTVPADTYYMRFYERITPQVYNHDICINISQPDTSVSPHNGDYLPYNAHNQRYKAIQEFAEIDMGTLNWTYLTQYQVFLSPNLPLMYQPTSIYDTKHIWCPKYVTSNISSSTAAPDKSIYPRSGTGNSIGVKDSSFTDVASFKAAMSGIKLTYQLQNYKQTEAEL